MLFCERSCLFHFNSSFFPSLHPSIHPRAVKCNEMHVWCLLNIQKTYIMYIFIYIGIYGDYIRICMSTDHSHRWSLFSWLSFLKAYHSFVIWFCSNCQTPPEKEILQWHVWWPKHGQKNTTSSHWPSIIHQSDNMETKKQPPTKSQYLANLKPKNLQYNFFWRNPALVVLLLNNQVLL